MDSNSKQTQTSSNRCLLVQSLSLSPPPSSSCERIVHAHFCLNITGPKSHRTADLRSSERASPLCRLLARSLTCARKSCASILSDRIGSDPASERILAARERSSRAETFACETEFRSLSSLRVHSLSSKAQRKRERKREEFFVLLCARNPFGRSVGQSVS